MTSDAPAVRIVDDDASMRESLVDLLASIGFTARAFPAVSNLLAEDTHGPGCLILDVRMPGESGLAFFKGPTFPAIRLPAIFMSGHADIGMAVQAMRLGAVDFLAKPFADQDLLDAVNRALLIDSERRRAVKVDTALLDRFAALSEGEKAVAQLVVAGLPNKEIAGRLGVSEITVKVRRGAAMRKVGAETLPDLVRFIDEVVELERSLAPEQRRS